MTYQHVTLSTLAGLILGGPSEARLPEARPNVVIIISDDQGWADIGYNNPAVYTPHLDKLAKGGARLDHHYVMPQCTPTRVALMTGRYPGRFGTQAQAANNMPAFPLGTPTIAAMFQEAGYETFMSGKWHLGSMAEHGPNKFGFDASHGSLTGAVGMYDHRYHAKPDTPYDPTWHRDHKIIPGHEDGTHVTDLTRDEAVRFIEKKRDRPFFLYLPFHAPHLPLDERGPFVDTPTQPDPKDPKRWYNEDKIRWFHDPQGLIQAEPSRDKRLLLATVHHLDSAVGDVVAALERTGQRENTLILFSSDNGPWVTNPKSGGYPHSIPLTNYSQPSPLRGRKLDVWEGGIHVPGFMNWPGTIPARQVQSRVHIVDWFPTLAKIIGYQPKEPIAWDGVDLSPVVSGDGSLPDRDLYWIWNQRTNRWALRYRHWKIVRYARKEPAAPTDWKLYDLHADPAETRDLSKSEPEVVADLHARFLVHRRKDRKTRWSKPAK
ncbi:MAG: sulfatase-like hydrolase/transferase [Planctomycetota bacterium]|nr:sulfatase-like hydrolase/transferase [Planctomycetota bacterium]